MTKNIKRRDFLKLFKSAGFVSFFPFSEPLFLSNLFVYRNESTTISWSENVQECPSISIDKEGNLWIAVLERNLPEKYIAVYNYTQNKLNEVTKVCPKGITGIGAPKLCPTGNSMILVFPIEKDNMWLINYTFINTNGNKDEPKTYTIPCINKNNVVPAVAVNDKIACVIWESGGRNGRGIYASKITSRGFSNPVQISPKSFNSYNPTIVALSNGDMFAAWDSIRNNGANIFGVWLKNGKWLSEIQLTSDVRLERHPYLASRENEVWMCWEAQSYLQRFSNNLTEQRIVVSKIHEKGLMAPLNLFNQVSPKTTTKSELSEDSRIMTYEVNPQKEYNLVRPRIAFDNNGMLWMSAREFMEKRQVGSKPVIWNYTGRNWEKHRLSTQQGKRQPVEIAFSKNFGYAVFQYDNLPIIWAEFGINPEWKSGFGISKIESSNKRSDLITEPLKMPQTDFSYEQKISLINPDLKVPKIRYKDRNLELFFGDLHSHSDISVCRRAWNQAPKDYYNTVREIEKLDFCALTDHGYNLDNPQWDFMGEQVRSNHDDKNFIIFLGQEWTSQGHPSGKLPKTEQGYGHHNLIFKDPYYQHYYDAYDGDINPNELWRTINTNKSEFICIPHQLADMGTNIPIDWNYLDEKFQPVAEIFQGRGSYEYLGCPRQAPDGAKFHGHYLQDVWAKKNIIGVIASPDHWGGIGKTGVWAEELSRESIFNAIRARHTYGTTGTKIGLLFHTSQAIMGDKIQLSSDPTYKFQIKVWAGQKINEIVIFRNNEIVYKTNPDTANVDIEWIDKNPFMKDFSWYYTRIQCVDNELAWSSPIWFL